ncbi:MAG: hypothetical protein FIB06_10550 [Betaproteobacteria bacterium]|nr:hypothetical protein [Betaproteobacteria bacterium]
MGTSTNPPAGRRPLRSQPGDFWLGAFMVAEAPLLLGLGLLEPATREQLLAVALGSPLGLAGTVAAAIALGLATGWLGHRLGFGR